LFCFAEGLLAQPFGEADPGGFGGRAPQNQSIDQIVIVSVVIVFFFFQKKKQKAFVLLRRRILGPTFGEADPGGFGGRAPQNQSIDQIVFVSVVIVFFFFQKKKQKAFVLLRRRIVGPTIGEADPGGFGGRAPQKVNNRVRL
jgi:uncharacterized membrane protein YtjA (UPF0391 family)